jgi:ribosomal protein S18 acetylase RimI-like enzyme
MTRDVVARPTPSWISPREAPEVLQLKRACFGPEYLLYSAYQSDASVSLLRELLDRKRHPDRVCRGLRVDGTLAAYFMAAEAGGSFHLSYVGTAPAWTQRGFATTLMDDFESIATRRGLTPSLDVFDHNTKARRWYRARGYRVVSRRETGLVNLAVGPAGRPAQVDAKELDHALEQENRRGAARVKIVIDGHSVDIGLIAGVTLRLHGQLPPHPSAVIRVLKGTFPARRALIVADPTAIPANIEYLHKTTLIRMALDAIPAAATQSAR